MHSFYHCPLCGIGQERSGDVKGIRNRKQSDSLSVFLKIHPAFLHWFGSRTFGCRNAEETTFRKIKGAVRFIRSRFVFWCDCNSGLYTDTGSDSSFHKTCLKEVRKNVHTGGTFFCENTREKGRDRTIYDHWSGSSSVYDVGIDSSKLKQYHFCTGICNLYGNRRCPDPNGCETIGEYRSHNREIVREVKRGSGCLKVCHIKDGILPGLFNKWSAGQPSRGNRRPFRFPCKVRRGKTAGSRGRNCIIKLTGAGFGAAHR